MKGEYISLQNMRKYEKPNEDFCICDDENGIYAVLDGVTRHLIDGRYPVPGVALEVSRIFASVVHEELIINRVGRSAMESAVMKGNAAIKSYNNGWGSSFLPSTVGVVVAIYSDKLSYAFIGDCYGRLAIKEGINEFTVCQTSELDKHRAEFTKDEIISNICNNSTHPCGYGVINGELRAKDFIKYGELALPEEWRLILSSDGSEPYLSSLSEDKLFKLTLESAVEQIQEFCSEGSDDKTILIVTPD